MTRYGIKKSAFFASCFLLVSAILIAASAISAKIFISEAESAGTSAKSSALPVIIIDAGHGGHDPGAIGKRGKEKNINLSVALKLGRLIKQNCPDTKVIYTREKDIFVPLHRRAEIANDAKADLFISIHTNSLAARNSKVRGTETYTLGLHRTQENLEVAKKEMP